PDLRWLGACRNADDRLRAVLLLDHEAIVVDRPHRLLRNVDQRHVVAGAGEVSSEDAAHRAAAAQNGDPHVSLAPWPSPGRFRHNNSVASDRSRKRASGERSRSPIDPVLVYVAVILASCCMVVKYDGMKGLWLTLSS